MIIDRLLMILTISLGFFCSLFVLLSYMSDKKRSNVHNRTTAVCMFALMYRHWFFFCLYHLVGIKDLFVMNLPVH